MTAPETGQTHPMVEPTILSVLGAMAIGVGWVLQHRAGQSDTRLRALLHRPLWWGGIAAMSLGQTATGVALQRGPITLVAPVLSTNLLCAFLLQSVLCRQRPPRRDLLGASGFLASVLAFMVIGGPHVTRGQQPADLAASVAGTTAVAAAALLLLIAGLRRGVAVMSVTAAVAAGLLYGLQDVATRAGLVLLERHAVGFVLGTIWPYLLLATATAAVLATQRALGCARLDYVLPPLATTEAVVGVILGVVLLGDRLDLTVPALAVEAACLLMLMASALLLTRSTALSTASTTATGAGAGAPQRDPSVATA